MTLRKVSNYSNSWDERFCKCTSVLQVWPILTSSDLNIMLPKKFETASIAVETSFLLFLRVFLALLDLELEGVFLSLPGT